MTVCIIALNVPYHDMMHQLSPDASTALRPYSRSLLAIRTPPRPATKIHHQATRSATSRPYLRWARHQAASLRSYLCNLSQRRNASRELGLKARLGVRTLRVLRPAVYGSKGDGAQIKRVPRVVVYRLCVGGRFFARGEDLLGLGCNLERVGGGAAGGGYLLGGLV